MPVIYATAFLENTNAFSSAVIFAFIFAFIEVMCYAVGYWLKIDGIQGLKKKIRWVVVTVLFRGFIIVPMVCACFTDGTEAGVLCLVAALWYLAGAYCLNKLFKNRTAEAQLFYGKILGFKRFIALSETSRIEALMKDDPDYYNEVLPFCIVADLSDKVDSQFAYLLSAAPDWSDGYDIKDFASAIYYSFTLNK